MSASHRDRRPPARRTRASSASARYRPARVVTNDEICRRGSTPPTSGSASAPGIVERRLRRAPTRSVVDMAVAAAEQGARRTPASTPDADRLRHRRHRHPPATRPRPRPPSVADRLGADQRRRVRHLRRLRRLLLRRSRSPTTWSAAAAPSTSSSSASRSSPTSSTRRPRHGVHLRRRRRRGRRRPVRRPRHRPGRLGLRRRADATRSRMTQSLARPARRPGDAELPDPGDAGPAGVPVGRRARWRRSRSRPSTPRASTADDLDAFIPHQANLRIIDAMVQDAQAARARRGRPRHRRHRQHVGGLDPAGHGRACSRAARPRSGGTRPAHRLRRRPGLRRPGRRRCPDRRRPHAPVPHRTTAPAATPRTEGAPHGHRAGDPRRPRRDRERGRRRPASTTSSSTSRSPTTSTSTRCRWSRSSWPPRRSSA